MAAVVARAPSWTLNKKVGEIADFLVNCPRLRAPVLTAPLDPAVPVGTCSVIASDAEQMKSRLFGAKWRFTQAPIISCILPRPYQMPNSTLRRRHKAASPRKQVWRSYEVSEAAELSNVVKL